MKPLPPYKAMKILRWFCRQDYLEEIEGDLLEVFERHWEESPFKAKWYLYKNVLKYLRPGFIKSISSIYYHITLAMFRHNLLVTFRNLKRYKNSFFINLIGLSTGLACTLLIFLWVKDEVLIDKFHENGNHIYQVMYNIPLGNNDTLTDVSTPGLLARSMNEEFSEVEYASSVIPPNWFDNEYGLVTIGDKRIKAKGQFIEIDYLKMFSWKLLVGHPDQVLVDKYAVLISDEMAERMFGGIDKALGKSIDWDQDNSEGTYQVTGVFEKPPKNSTANFDLLFNYQSIFEMNIDNLEKWSNSSPSTIIQLRKGVDVDFFNQKIKNYSRNKYEAISGPKYLKYIGTLFLHQYTDRYLYNHFDNGVQDGGRIAYVRLFSIIALFLLTIAIINFMNLSTARASRRLKEIGIKKAIGVNRGTLVLQFLAESVLMAFLALLVALLIVLLILPEFNTITDKTIGIDLTLNFGLSLFVITFLTGLFAGGYPALYLSGFKPVVALKGKLGSATSAVLGRKALVVFQFVVSVTLIIAVIVVYKQIELIQTKNLGYNKDNVISFKAEGHLDGDLQPFLNGLENIPGVMKTSSFGHDLVGEYGGTGALKWPGQLEGEKVQFGNLEVDYNWFELLEIKLVEGRPYSKNFGAEGDKIIFNEAAIKAMDLKDPIGKVIKLWGKEKQIIGVAKNFHFESLYEKVKPCFIQCYPNLNSILVKIEEGREREVIEKIENYYDDYNEGLPFNYQFMDEDYQKLYSAEKRVAILSKYFAGVAILISCLGLFGLATFTAERRLKEIGIRKVLGAGRYNIIHLMAADFTKMVAIGIFIALPLSYILARQWLSGFAYHIELMWWFFTGAGLIALLIAWFTIGIQTIKAANTNPVDCLKDE